VNPIQAYIEKRKQEFNDKFPQVYDGSDVCIKEEVENFLISCMIGVLDVIEQEIDSVFGSESPVIYLDNLAYMFDEIRSSK